MEISKYDEYIPEKELDTKFKIPRKRTAEDSFGAQAGEAYEEYYARASETVKAAQAVQYGQYVSNQKQNQPAQLNQTQGPAGAATQASTSTNSKPPVRYPPVPPPDLTMKPPLLATSFGGITRSNTSTNSAQASANIFPSFTAEKKSLGPSTSNSNVINNANHPSSGNNENWNESSKRRHEGNTFSKSANNVNSGNNSGDKNWNNFQNRNWNAGRGDNVLNKTNNMTNLGSGNRNFGGNMNRSWGSGTDPQNKDLNNFGGPNRSWSENRTWSACNSIGDNNNWNRKSFGGNNWNSRNMNDDFNSSREDHNMLDEFPGDRRQDPPGFFGGNKFGNNRFVNDQKFDEGFGNKSGLGFASKGFGFGEKRSFGFGEGGGRVFDDKDRFLDRGGFGFRDKGGFGFGNKGRFELGNKGRFELEDKGRFGFGDESGFGSGSRPIIFEPPRGIRNEPEFMGRDRGAQGGRGRGMFGQDDGGNWRGGFRGGRGRGFGRNDNDRTNSRDNSRPFQRKEKPKNIKPSMAPITVPDVNDESLPKDLRMMFQPLYCKLCSLQMSSNVMAKMHYKSKNHEKKIRKYLIEHAEKTGEPLHPRALTTASQEKKEKEEDKDPKYFHCDVCDLPLTGKLHAESHYMGKNHNAVVMGKKRPSGKGHYNEEGKWVRDPTEEKTTLAEGEDNFGLAFRQVANDADAEGSNDTPAEKGVTGKFTCSICNVSCTCQEQINMHFAGAKHKKKLKLQGISIENFEVPKESETEGEAKDLTGGESSDSKLDSADATAVERNDFSRYKTPSGYYYCGKCNLTLNSEVQLKQHLTSKNHLKKSSKKIEQQNEIKKE